MSLSDALQRKTPAEDDGRTWFGDSLDKISYVRCPEGDETLERWTAYGDIRGITELAKMKHDGSAVEIEMARETRERLAISIDRVLDWVFNNKHGGIGLAEAQRRNADSAVSAAYPLGVTDAPEFLGRIKDRIDSALEIRETVDRTPAALLNYKAAEAVSDAFYSLGLVDDYFCVGLNRLPDLVSMSIAAKLNPEELTVEQAYNRGFEGACNSGTNVHARVEMYSGKQEIWQSDGLLVLGILT
ncbi:hypothetical protein GF351_02960 [Candidatus Woesearchaeota archaeon]|nr:hypothetical protein [Candidatus Woesearchaeota archaeon]